MARFCKRRLSASATPSALCLSGCRPKGSSIELDWSIKKRKQVGFERLISAVYGMDPTPVSQTNGNRQAPATGSVLYLLNVHPFALEGNFDTRRSGIQWPL